MCGLSPRDQLRRQLEDLHSLPRRPRVQRPSQDLPDCRMIKIGYSNAISFDPLLFLGHEGGVLVVDAVVLGSAVVDLVEEEHVHDELGGLDSDEHELVAVLGEHQVVGSEDDGWGRRDVDEAQQGELDHELLEAQAHGAVGAHAADDKDEEHDQPEADEDAAADVVEDVVAVVGVADLGDHRDDDVDDAQRTH